MGSWFSFPAPAGRISVPRHVMPRDIKELKVELSGLTDGAFDDIHLLASEALKHYNSIHPGAEFRSLAQPMKVACVGFRKDLWYHVNFLARRRTYGNDERTFFAELCLCYNNSSHGLIVKTCAILEKPFRTSCTMCPDDSKILHPYDAEFVCGKEGHEREFFRERCAKDGHTMEFFSESDMLSTPFLLGGTGPRYRLAD